MITTMLLGTVSAAALVAGVGGPSPYVVGPPRAPYWRVKGTVSGSFNGGALSEVGFYSALGDAATNTTGGTPSAGSEAFGGLATNAFDGIDEANAGGMWAGASGAIAAGTSWLAYDYGEWTEIAEISLTARSGGNSNQMWDEFDLEWSIDGITWYLWQSYVDTGTWASVETRRYAVTDDQKVAVDIIYQDHFIDTLGSSLTQDITQTDDAEGHMVIVALMGQNTGTMDIISYDGVVPNTVLFKRKEGTFDIMTVAMFKGITGTGVKQLVFAETGSAYRVSAIVWVVKNAGDLSNSITFSEGIGIGAQTLTATDEGGAIGVGMSTGEMVLTTTLDTEVLPNTNVESTFYIRASQGQLLDHGDVVSFAVDGSDREFSVLIHFEKAETSSKMFVSSAHAYALVGRSNTKISIQSGNTYAIVGRSATKQTITSANAYAIIEE